MEESNLQLEYLQELPKANPIQKKTIVQPRSLFPQLPLPNFRYSDEEVELAPTFSVLDQKEQHTLKETNLSKLFENPLYQSNPRFISDANNLKFACLKAYYTESGLHPPPAVRSQPSDPELQFESRFQSGNLAYVQRSQLPNEYLLLLQKDINTSRCTQWFFFRVSNGKFKGKARFHILNFLKNYSSFESGMKISQCKQSNGYCWIRGGEDITYLRNNVKIQQEKSYYTLSFSFVFEKEDDIVYFAHSPPYTFSMMDRHLLNISNNPQLATIVKRKTLTESPGGNYIDMLTITNFKSSRSKKVVFVTSRVHPGETPASFVCQGLLNYLISSTDDAKKLRDNFIFKVVPMLNPDGVINGNYRCSLSGYDLNRVWHYDNKQSSPEIYYTKRAILDQEKCFMFIDLHAHSKKKGVFMYGCQNRASPFISRHIPYLFWKEIPSFNYYQCNFGMRIGREGTSRLSVHRLLNLPYSYTMEHSFCGPMKEKHHFTSKNYRDIGSSLCATLRKYFCNRDDGDQIYKELYTNKELGKVGDGEDGNSSEDSQLDAPIEFKELLENRKIIRRKPSSSFRSKIMDASSTPSATKLPLRPPRDLSPRKYYQPQDILQPFINKTLHQPHMITKKLLQSVPEIPDVKISEQIEIKGEEVFLSARISQQEDSPEKLQPQTFMLRATSRYEFQEMQSLNNLFLPSLTSASYKRYAKKKNYTKQFVQVGKKYLQTNGILKQQIRSVSRKKAGWKDQILTYI